MLVWTNFFTLSLSLSLSLSQDRLDRASPFHSLSSSPFLLRVPRVLLSVFLSLSFYIYIYSNPRFHLRFSLRVCSHALRRIFVSFRVPVRSPVASSFFFSLSLSIVHSPAPLALQTLLADEARFVLNFLNFIFRGFPKFSLPFSFNRFIHYLDLSTDSRSRYNLTRR